MAGQPYSKSPIDLGPASLAPFCEATARTLAEACGKIDPWVRMAYPVDGLSRFFLRPDPTAHRYALHVNQALAGGVVVRHPWLKGPYLEFLAILPDHQSNGVGGAILDWFENEVAGTDRNIWVLVSDFNTRALAFYQRHGFEPVAPLPGVAVEGFTEILLRKQLGLSGL